MQIQKTGFAAALDNRGRVVAGPRDAHIPHKLGQSIRVGEYAGAARRVMVLGAEDIGAPPPEQSAGEGVVRPGASGGDMLYLLGYFRPLDWNLVVAAPLDELDSAVFSLVARQFALTLGIVLGGILVALLLAGRITGPIRRLTAVAASLPSRDLLTLDGEDLGKELPVKRRDEIGGLARSFSFMAAKLHENILKLVEATAKSERIASELQVAHDIQYGILPEPLESLHGGDLFALMVTAKEVGGDLYDYFYISEDEICFLVGDVSDKSVPAALFMSMAVTTMRSYRPGTGLTPSAMIGHVNNVLARHNPRNMFVTLCVGVLNLKTGHLTWSAAGHMPPVLLSADGARELEASGDVMAGVFEDMEYRLLETDLKPGEGVFLYTDGVSEAFDLQEDMYGRERLLPALSQLYGQEAKAVAEKILAEVQAFAGEAPQSDDIAVMCLRYLGR